jgi:photosystem II stability/assembly factor-like uncharacterized protein
MKKTLLLFTLLIISTLPAFSQWKALSNWGGDANKGRSVCAHQGILYAATSNGFYRSTDEGLHWEQYKNLAYTEFNSVAVTDKGVIFLVAVVPGGHRMLVSHSKGFSWKETTLPTQYWPGAPLLAAGPYVYYYAYRRHEDSEQWAIAPQLPASVTNVRREGDNLWASYANQLYRSGDFGDSWTPLNPAPTSVYFFRFDVRDSIVLATKGENNGDTIGWRSTNYGATFSKVDLPEAFAQVYAAKNYFVGVSRQGDLYRSDDGLSWEFLHPSIASYWTGLGLAQAGNAVVLPYPFGLLRSDDGGHNWLISNTGLAGGGTLTHQAAGDYVMASGRHFSNDGGQTWAAPVHPTSTFEPNSFKQFYPYKGEWRGKNSSGLYKASSNFSTWTQVPSVWPDGGVPSFTSMVQLGDTLVANSNLVGGQFRIYRSVDGGGTWEGVHKDQYEIRLLGGHNHRVIGWRGPGQINNYVVSADYGATWTTFANGAFEGSTSPHILRSESGKLYDLRNTPSGPNIFSSDDDGQTWKAVANSLLSQLGGSVGMRDFWVQGDRIYVTATHYQGTDDRVFVSIDGGKTWSDFSGDIDAAKVDLGKIFVSGSYLCFTNLKNGELWMRPLSDIDRNQVTGSVYFDFNKTGVREPQEAGVPYQIVRSIPGQLLSATNPDGDFLLLDTAPNDTIRAIPTSKFMDVVPPFQLAQGNKPLEFGLQWKNIKDMRVHLNTAATHFVSGKPAQVYINLNNEGPQPLSGTLQLRFTKNVVLKDTEPAVTSQTDSTVTWDYADLKAFQNQQITLTFIPKPPPVESNTVCFIAHAPIVNDTTPPNNSDTLKLFLFYPFDPNDKQVSRHELTPEQVAQSPELNYRIRFQNTGNYPAFRVRLLDTLSQWVEPSSLRVRATSHPCTLAIRGTNILEFIFNDINLPDSISDEPNSHGFVQYTVRTRSDVPLDTAILNRAHIFFDFNPPITTNTAQTLIKQFLRTRQIDPTPLRLAPNPAGDVVRILDSEDFHNRRVEIFNATGQHIRSQQLTSPASDIDLQGLAPGAYYLACYDKAHIRVAKFIKI